MNGLSAHFHVTLMYNSFKFVQYLLHYAIRDEFHYRH